MSNLTVPLPADPLRAGPGRARWWAVGALTLSVLVVALDSYVLVTALPTLSTVLGASTSQLQWITAGYTLASTALLLPAGKLGDRVGRRRALVVGLVIFGAASLVASRAETAGALIGLRAVMGVGGALIMPMALAVVPGMFAARAERQRAVAVTAMGAMLGLPLGPLLAGWLLDHFAWGSIFLINGPVVVLAIAGVLLFVPESRDPATSRVDWLGSLLSAGAVAGLVYGAIEQPVDGWSGAVLAALAGGAALAVVFVVQQAHARYPLVDLGLFRSRAFTGGSIAFSVLGFVLGGVLFLLTPFLQVVQGNDAQGTGLRLLTMIGAMLVGAAVAEKILAPRLGAGILVPAGMVVAAVGLVVLPCVHADSGYGILAVALALVGLGLGLSLPLAVDAQLGALSPDQTGVGNAMSRTMQGVGVAFGTAFLGSVLNGAYRSRLATAPETARASVAGAHTLADRVPGVADAADRAYAHGLAVAGLLCAAVLVISAVVVRVALRRTAT
jgi:DHA2 family multidrug resistance protein-like MFS transporter